MGAIALGPHVFTKGQLGMKTPLLASRGLAKEMAYGRGAKIVANVKQKRGMYARYRRNEMWLRLARDFKGRQKNVYRQARQAVMDALKKKYRSRRLFKRERRQLWIMRVRANCRLHGIRYSRFICKLKEANVNINRKILSQLAVYDRPIFTNIMDVAMPYWRKIKAKNDYVRPKYTAKQMDDIMIPEIEKTVPEIYTDATIRFNRQVKEGWVEYTVDMGDPDMWREALPKMPELANFQLPDHWMSNGNAEWERLPLSAVPVPAGYESPEFIKFMEKVKKTQAEDEEKAKRGEKTWPKKEGVSRDDWFKDEPQTWF